MPAAPAKTAAPSSFLRVWPLDFTSYLLEAEHDSPATCAALAPGGLRVAAGCEDGALGVLDIASHRYASALRSHCGAVLAVAARHSACVRGGRACGLAPGMSPAAGAVKGAWPGSMQCNDCGGATVP